MTSLAITKIVPVGDVLHVFSHIKKTYRVQWVLLEGGDRPPLPLDEFPPEQKRPVKKSKREIHSDINPSNFGTAADVPKNAVWTPLEDVVNTK